MMNGIAVSLRRVGDQLPAAVQRRAGGRRTSTCGRTSSPSRRWSATSGSCFGITPGAHLSWLLFLAIGAAIVVWFLIRRTRLGYEARAVGSSPGSAKAGGISIGATQLQAVPDLGGARRARRDAADPRRPRTPAAELRRARSGSPGSPSRSSGRTTRSGSSSRRSCGGSCRAARSALQIETEVPREFIIILQGILILSVVITYQIAKRRLAARQLQRAGAAGELEDSAGPAETRRPRGRRRGHRGVRAGRRKERSDAAHRHRASRSRSRSRTSRSSI